MHNRTNKSMDACMAGWMDLYLDGWKEGGYRSVCMVDASVYANAIKCWCLCCLFLFLIVSLLSHASCLILFNHMQRFTPCAVLNTHHTYDIAHLHNGISISQLWVQGTIGTLQSRADWCEWSPEPARESTPTSSWRLGCHPTKHVLLQHLSATKQECVCIFGG